MNTEAEYKMEVNGDMTIYEAGEINDLFLKALAEHNKLNINLSAVSEIDSSGLQLMVSLKKDAEALEKTVQFSSHSKAVIDFLDLFDMTSFFGDPIIMGN